MGTRTFGRPLVLLAIPLAFCVSLTACSRGTSNNKAVDRCFVNLPPGWTIVESFLVSSDQVAAIEQKLGAAIETLSNTVLSVHGQQIQVNLIDCPTEDDAKTIHTAISAMKGHPAFCLRRRRRVIEFVGESSQLAIKAGYELGFAPKPKAARFRITADLVPIDECDYMSFNELFSLFVRVQNHPDDQEAKARIRELSQRFRFGERITLRTAAADAARPVYRFTPEPDGEQTGAEGETVTYAFKETPNRLGVPHVALVAEIKTRSDGLTSTTRDEAEQLVAATEFWPVDDPEIVRLARSITSKHPDRAGKVEAILRWLTPGKNIEFGGPVVGSRWGVKKVLEQGCGQCWDFSDCFVTLCRASGIPCRQVGGWLYGASGHIWAEVLIEGKGWQQVDATGGGKLQCGIYHIPCFITETGEMPILYVSMPEIEILETE